MTYDTDMYETDEGAALVFTDDGYCYFGTSRDMYLRWDGTDFNIVPAAADSVIEFGTGTYPPDLKIWGGDSSTYVYWDNDGGSGSTGEWAFGVNDHGVDVKFYGATASAYALWDESANELLFEGADLWLKDDDQLEFGDSSDVVIDWATAGGLYIAAATDNSMIYVGSGSAGFDLT